MRNIFIGDVHGCFDEFKLLIANLELTDTDKVYLVWDMINKWPKSVEMLEFLYEHQDQYICVKWNHEVGFLNWLNGDMPKYDCPEYQELKIYVEKNIEALAYLKELPLYQETSDFIVLHGGLIPGKALDQQSVDDITRLREYQWRPWHSYYTWEKPIIYGHWAIQWLHVTHNTIWLDSRCVYWGELTAYILETKSFVSQKALKQYIDPFADHKCWKK
jgi:serine/threonine protein phosphatase 1